MSDIETWFAVSHPSCWNQPLALFRTDEESTEWGRDNYPSQYLIREIELPFIKLFTDEQIEQSRKEGERIFKVLAFADD